MPDIPDFSVKQSFPIAGVADLIAQRSYKEALMQQAQREQLLQGLKDFGGIATTLVARRQAMAQALAAGNYLGMTPDQSQGLGSPEHAINAYKARSGEGDLNLLKTLFPQLSMLPKTPPAPTATAGTTPAAPVAPAPAQPAPPVLGAPQLASASATLSGGLPPPTTAQTPTPMPATSDATSPNALLPNMRVGKGTMGMIKTLLGEQPHNVLQYTPGKGLANVGQANKGDQVITSQPGAKQDGEYDKLENQVINRIVGIRGDKSLARTEEQRDAAIQAYNTIAQVKNENRLPNQLEYYDILGQMWKARSGSAPTDQAIKELDAKTFKGDLGKAYQYFSGDAAPRTTEGVMNAIQDFADKTGKMTDKLHSGYMQSHLIKPKNMSQSDFESIVKAHRGLSFDEATADNRVSASSANGIALGGSDGSRLAELRAKKAAGTLR